MDERDESQNQTLNEITFLLQSESGDETCHNRRHRRPRCYLTTMTGKSIVLVWFVVEYVIVALLDVKYIVWFYLLRCVASRRDVSFCVVFVDVSCSCVSFVVCNLLDTFMAFVVFRSSCRDLRVLAAFRSFTVNASVRYSMKYVFKALVLKAACDWVGILELSQDRCLKFRASVLGY